MKVLGIIPSRFGSTRFPGKPLAEIKGKSMVMRVFEQAKKATKLDHVVVATDDQQIYAHIVKCDGKAVLTSAKHPSGTDRCREAAEKIQGSFDVVINIQGDEPFIDPKQIDLLVDLFEKEETEIASLYKPLQNHEELINPNAIKVVLNQYSEALYFSRSPIPFVQNYDQSEWIEQHDFHRHIGIYGFRVDILKEITNLKLSSLESAESLEQLRWLQNGFKIKMALSNHDSLSIDTPEDLVDLLRRL